MKTKDLSVDLQRDSIDIKYIKNNQQIIKGRLFDQIKQDESYWTIEDSTVLVLTLEKNSENIWKTVIEGDQEIDAS